MTIREALQRLYESTGKRQVRLSIDGKPDTNVWCIETLKRKLANDDGAWTVDENGNPTGERFDIYRMTA